MKIRVSESQLKFLTEAIQGKLFDLGSVQISNINKRCKETIRLKIPSSPWCSLKKMRMELPNEELKVRLDNAIDKLLKYYGKKNTGVLPGLIEIALIDSNKTISDLETLGEFFETNESSHDRIKKILKGLNLGTQIPSKEELYNLFSQVKGIANKEYEDSFDGREFKIKRTALKLNHRCSELNTDDKVFNLIKKIQDELPPENLFQGIEILSKNLISCIGDSMTKNLKPVKADLELKTPLYVKTDNTMVEVFPPGFYEVKKMDPYVDSYLSEFLAIFKESSLKSEKSNYLKTYNEIIDNIFKSIMGKQSENLVSISNEAKDFLEKIKENVNGIIFDNNLIVPIKYIEFYWSNTSRGSDEKRLCIRYKLIKGVKPEIYRYTKGSNILEKVTESSEAQSEVKK